MAHPSSHLRKTPLRGPIRPGAWLLTTICLPLALLAGRASAADTDPTPGPPHDLGLRIAPGDEPAAPNKSDEPGNTPINPGESLALSIAEDPSFNGVYQVRRGGYIIMPQVGRIAVAGKSLSAVEAAVERALQSSLLPNASVKIERRPVDDVKSHPLIYLADKNPLIHLAGEFRTPGEWRVPSGVEPTLVNVIRNSGGVTDKADLTRVRVKRLGVCYFGPLDEFNVAKITEGGGVKGDIPLGRGDVVTIPAIPRSHP